MAVTNINLKYISRFLCETEEDISTLPLNVPDGSIAIVMDNGKGYIFNQGNWVAMPNSVTINFN